ncbi:MAG: 6-bladed beta-propeller [Tannerellaceae bacterium]|nr:6-bladed beta-propeller [Tannerellaceae bacterium]
MNNNKLLPFLLILSLYWSCTRNVTEKHHTGNNPVDVRDKVEEIPLGNIDISNLNALYLIDDFLLIRDWKSPENLVYVFDKNTFRFIANIIPRGQGPGEIANIGHIAVDEALRRFYVTDNGKQEVFAYPIDSILADADYIPEKKATINVMHNGSFPDKYQYICDTLCIGLMVERSERSRADQYVGKWNMQTGKITPMKYERIQADRSASPKRIAFAASEEHNLYVEAYQSYDLLTICTLNGELRYNIYGPKWSSRKLRSNRIAYYDLPAFVGNQIVVLYLGGDQYTADRQHAVYPSQFRVFDLDGNYLKTLETGHQIAGFVYDKDNNRILMNLEHNDIQFACLPLDGLQ